MPNPNTGESRADFLERCIPQVIEEGREPEQAVAMCISYYEGKSDKAFNLDEENQVMYWKAVDNRRETFQSKYERKILKALRAQLSIYEGAYDIQDLRRQIDDTIMYDAIEELYADVGDKFARNVYQGLKGQPYPETKETPIWIRRVIEGMDKKRISDISKTTKLDIEKIIRRGLEMGLTTQQIAEELMERGVDPARARTIARTEIVSASNLGSLMGARSTGLNYKKIWISTPDDRTRRPSTNSQGGLVSPYDHRPGKIEPVGKEDPFILRGPAGDEYMDYPGDSNLNATPGNIVNCRCSIGYELL